MSKTLRFNRRTMSLALAASTAAMLAGVSLPASSAFAQAVTADDWKKLLELAAEAKKLGINLPQITAPASGASNFADIVPAVLDFINHLEEAESTPAGKASAAAIEKLEQRASDLLHNINAKEKHPRQGMGGAPSGFLASLVAGPANAANGDDPTYDKWRQGYLDLFDTCVVRPERQSTVNFYVDTLTATKNRSIYEQVEEAVCVPWYFIGAIHALETSFNFRDHLHNGDPISARTFHVPAGRPKQWLPPSDWVSSAKDALEYEKYTNHTDWNLAKLLYRLEKYNGTRSRLEHGINTPYLWSFSNHYTSGKFVADNVWSSVAVSNQPGTAVMIKELVKRQVIVPVA